MLVRRYEGTRRRHPLTGDGEGVIESIALERELLEPIRESADVIIDTSELNVHQLRERLLDLFAHTEAETMQIQVVSFGFKHGVPIDADTVFDCRFLPNPHWVDELRPLTGLDEPVRRYVLDQPDTTDFLDRVDDLLALVLPAYVKEGKSYLTIAIGCTGGRHRSVVLAEELTRRIAGRGFTPAGAPPGHRPVSGAGARRGRLTTTDPQGKWPGPGASSPSAAAMAWPPPSRAVRRYAGDITAIVSVADDGGSSGRLRDAFGMPAPGDLRRCLVALGDPDSLWGRAFEYRFEAGELEGHAARQPDHRRPGRRHAATSPPPCSRRAGWWGPRAWCCRRPPARWSSRPRWGARRWSARSGCRTPAGRSPGWSWCRPTPSRPPAAPQAIAAADQVILGPGSLYTSVLAVAVVPALRQALAARRGGRVYVCNLRPQIPETAGFDAAAHVERCGPTASTSTWSCSTRAPCQPVASMYRSSKHPSPGLTAWRTTRCGWQPSCRNWRTPADG